MRPCGTVRGCLRNRSHDRRATALQEIQLQRQVAGIASRYHGTCPYQARHATFVFGTDRFRLGGSRFAQRRNGSGSSRAHDHSLERARVVCA